MSLSATTNFGVTRLLKRRLQQFGCVQLTSHGVSMYPFIKAGDKCLFKAVEPNGLSEGDVILYRTVDDNLVGHRVVQIICDQQEVLYLCKGDANRYPDPPIPFGNVLARLVVVQRRQKTIYLDSNIRRLWSWAVLRMPLVSRACRWTIIQQQIWRTRLQTLKTRS